ncbi:unnamed protein product, partial [Didymodactylos carnosus]
LAEKEESSSATTTNLRSDTDTTTQFKFKYFDSKRIDPFLLQSSSFIQVVHLVESLIENRNLNVYFAHVAIPELRPVNLFDKQQSLQYSDQIKTFLCGLVQDLRYSVKGLPDAYSHFLGNYAVDSTSKDDVIEYDTTTINGIISLEKSNRTTPAIIAKQVFLIFAKTLHELGHASIYRSGRLMLSTSLHVNKANVCSHTPATHALSGEAGNAVERFLFGSVIGTLGKTNGDLYIIKEILLQEQKPNGVIDSSWLQRFIALDLTNLNEIPKIIYIPLTNKKLKAAKSSPKCAEAYKSDGDYDSENEDEDDEPLLTTTN